MSEIDPSRRRPAGWRVYPPFFVGATAGPWWRALARWGGHATPRHWPALAFTGLSTSACSAFAALQRALLGRRLRAVRLDPPPVIVLGLWRTGTTLAHELLAGDPRHTAPNTYQCFAPAHFLVTERVLAPIFGLLSPRERPQDAMILGMNRAQEDEFAMAALGLPSPYCVFAFPRRERAIADHVAEAMADPAGRARWRAAFLAFLRAVAWRRPGRLVLKSPTHAARVPLLLEALPEARFVYTVRDPIDAVPSWIHTVEALCRAFGLQRAPPDGYAEIALRAFEETARRFEADRAAIPPGRLFVLRYETLAAEPEAALARLYRELDLGPFDPARATLGPRLAETKRHRRGRYDPPAALRERIERQFRWYRELYGYA